MRIQDSPLENKEKLTYTSPEFSARSEIPSLAILAAEVLEHQSNFSLPPSAACDHSMSVEDQVKFVEEFISQIELEDQEVQLRDREIQRREIDALAQATLRQLHPNLNFSDEPNTSCNCTIL